MLFLFNMSDTSGTVDPTLSQMFSNWVDNGNIDNSGFDLKTGLVR